MKKLEKFVRKKKMSEFYGREQFKKGYPNLYKQLKDEVRQETLKEVLDKSVNMDNLYFKQWLGKELSKK